MLQFLYSKWSFMNSEPGWKKATSHLENAFRLLPENFKEGNTETATSFKDFIGHNELELAIEQLEGLGEQNSCKPEFWEQLIIAAENMDLQKSVEYYKTKLNR